jgi:hypothetical protein
VISAEAGQLFGSLQTVRHDPLELHAGIAQLARASAFQAEGRGFESRFPLHMKSFLECLQRVVGLGNGRSHLGHEGQRIR